jgi:acyl carrier protein
MGLDTGVKQIVIAHSGADPEAVTPVTSFIEDLRLD